MLTKPNTLRYKHLRLILFVLLLIPSSWVLAQAPPPAGCSGAFNNSFTLTGNANLQTGYIQLTPNTNNQSGQAWSPQQISLNNNYTIEFRAYFGGSDIGADGFAFVLRGPTANPVGGAGQGIGYGNITPSIAVEFDTYQNGFDIVNDHISVQRNGNPDIPGLIGSVVDLGNIEDGAWHDVRIVWNGSSKVLEIHLDGVLRSSITRDIVALDFGGNPLVYFGFTSSTGGLTNEHAVCVSQLIGCSVAITGNTTPCPGASTVLTAVNTTTSGTALNYAWSNGQSGATQTSISVSTLGTYTVTVTNSNGCTSSSSVTVVNSSSCPENCTNGIDDDLDGLTDCADSDCYGNILVNGSFENVGVGQIIDDGSSNQYVPGGSTTEIYFPTNPNPTFDASHPVGTNANLPGWVVETTVDIGRPGEYTSTQALDLNGLQGFGQNGSLYQCVSVVPGSTYSLQFRYANPFGGAFAAPNSTFDLYVWRSSNFGNSADQILLESFNNPSTNIYTNVLRTFTVPAGITQICIRFTSTPPFGGQGGQPYPVGATLDDIALIPGINTMVSPPPPACPGASLTLSATFSAPTTFRWYTAATGGTLLQTSPSNVTSNSFNVIMPSTAITYYVEVEAGSCRSPRFPVVLGVSTSCPENCSNGIDDDGDGAIDAFDPDCNTVTCSGAVGQNLIANGDFGTVSANGGTPFTAFFPAATGFYAPTCKVSQGYTLGLAPPSVVKA